MSLLITLSLNFNHFNFEIGQLIHGVELVN